MDTFDPDDLPINPSGRAQLEQLADPARRRLLRGAMGLALLGLGSSLPGRALLAAGSRQAPALPGFAGVAVQLAADFDRVVVPAGYVAEPLFSWGDPVVEGAPVWRGDAGEDWQAQALQAGDNHDGMHFFPFPGDVRRGLLVVNHEYSNPPLHPHGPQWVDGRRPLDEVRKEQAAHGVSVIELLQGADGRWQRVYPSRFNRRITASTPMRISGPLAGHALLRTASDPEGRRVLGTLNNCALGVTPWGTYLACEENWHLYFANQDAADLAQRVSHWRYGIASTARSGGWDTADPRFDATPQPQQPHGGEVNEPHRFGWVVEIDPFDPDSTPVKRTAFGRFCREGASLALGPDGRMAFYSGDDTRGEYLYKFVPDGRHDPARPAASRDLLDSGTLYVARCNADGSGQWLALRHGEHGLNAAAGFPDQASVLVNARAAADLAGATPLDRPEWVAVHPHTREGYVSLSNNDRRGTDDAVDAANPRAHNLHGHILRWREEGDDPTATRFRWELFGLAGEPAGSGAPQHLRATLAGDHFSSPDGLAFDSAGRLWIATDYDDDAAAMASMGCNQLLCADPASRTVRRFLVGPRGCEITGIAFSPDGCTLWVNVQHPGLSYPASDGVSRPRSTTVQVRRTDGGLIGS